MKKKLSKKFIIFNYLATYAIALIAIAGFIYSIHSSNQTAKVLKSFEQNLSSFLEPVLVFSDFNWVTFSGNTDCDNPPSGFNAIYTNKSNIPIKLFDVDHELFYGDYKISSSESANPDNEYFIIPPGETSGFTQMFINDPVQEMMKKKYVIIEKPYLRVIFKAKMSTIDESKIYEIELVTDVGVGCHDFHKTILFFPVKSDYVLIHKNKYK